VSGGGYGGPGHSGGDGDALVRIVNVGNFSAGLTQPGDLCANIFVFDAIQQLQECCDCFVSANGVRTLSVINDLTSNPAFNGAKMSLGAIKIIGSDTFFGFARTPQRTFSREFWRKASRRGSIMPKRSRAICRRVSPL